MSKINMGGPKQYHAFADILGENTKENLVDMLHWCVSVLCSHIEQDEGVAGVVQFLGENLSLTYEQMQEIGVQVTDADILESLENQ